MSIMSVGLLLLLDSISWGKWKFWRSDISMEFGSCFPKFLSFWGVITTLRRCEDWGVIEDWSGYLREEKKERLSVLGKKSKINDHLLLQVSLVRSKSEVNFARKARMEGKTTTKKKNWFWTWAIGSIIFRFLVIYFSQNVNLTSRPEVATPLTSLRRLAEGYWLKRTGMSPYTGSMYHGSPLLLSLLGPITVTSVGGRSSYPLCRLPLSNAYPCNWDKASGGI